METTNPFRDEQVQTNEERIAELKAEMARLDRSKAYIWSLLVEIDPESRAIEDFIERAYEGS